MSKKLSTGDVVSFQDGRKTYNALVLSNQDGVLAIVYVVASEEHSFGARFERVAGVVEKEKGEGVYIRQLEEKEEEE